jgi:signal transduction histidine kinase
MVPILIATCGVIVLGVLRIGDALASASAADRAQSLSTASGQLVNMVHLIGREFVQTGAALRADAPWSAVDGEIATTDANLRHVADALNTVRTDAPDLDELCGSVERSLSTLQFVRWFAHTERDGSPTVLAYYDATMLALLAVADAIPAHLNDTQLVELAQSVALIGHLDRLAVLQLDLIDRSLHDGRLGATDAINLPSWAGEERTRVATLRNLAEPSRLYDAELGTTEISTADGVMQSVISTGAGAVLDANGTVWLTGQTARITGLDHLRDTLTTRLSADAAAAGQTARKDMLLTAGLSGLGAVLTMVTGTGLAVRTSRRLRRTRAAALVAANTELPTAIADVIAAADENLVRRVLATSFSRVDSMLGRGTDEIGELSSAFAAVHRQALRLAADQALLRMDVQAIFTALSRRGQTLVQRQLDLIDSYGRDEADPDALSRLFALDHLAARMRRNEENLLVLAGGEPARWITRPAALVDLLRAAAQEIEEYSRVEIATETPPVAISASVAGDAIHLLAELMENATTFSPPAAPVVVHARRDQHGLTIEIHDSGIGMPPDKVAEANDRLRHPAQLTSRLVGTMGLLVVARLAVRHGLTVRLDSRPARGTTAVVALPERLLTSASVSDSPSGARALPWTGSRSAIPLQRTVPRRRTDPIDATRELHPVAGPPGLPDPDQLGAALSGLWQGLNAAREHRPGPQANP